MLNGVLLTTHTGNCIDYKMEGVLYDTTSKYDGLLRVIASQIGVDTRCIDLVIQYIVNMHSPPLKIHNDMEVRVYLD